MNLLQETIQAIQNSGHTPTDICFIGSEDSGHCCTWEEFITLANQEYDNDFGWQEVAMDLIIVFHDGQKLCRQEYDGSEWWNCIKPFTAPLHPSPLHRLISREHGWVTLADMHKESTEANV